MSEEPIGIDGAEIRDRFLARFAGVETSMVMHPDEHEIIGEVKRMRVREEATRRFRRAEVEKSWDPPEVRSLADWDLAPPVPAAYRIQDLCIVGGNTTIAAQYKAGKTTLAANRCRSLVDGVPFLGEFPVVTPLDGNVIYLNYEVSESQFYAWLTRLGIKNKHRIIPINLRGRGVFIQDDSWCEWLVKVIKEHSGEVIEMDPLSAAIRGNTSSEEVASDFLTRLDAVKHDSGAKDLFLTTHTGHLSNKDSSGRAQNERTSGSARFMGWPDAFWTYTFDEDKTRYLSAMGRDVDVEEFSLAWDPDTIGLTVASRKTNRANKRSEQMARNVVDFLAANPASPTSRVTDAVTGNAATVRATLKRLAAEGVLTVSLGTKNASLWSVSGAAAALMGGK